MTAIVAIDTETTGLHPDREVWEVAMIRRAETTESKSFFVTLTDMPKADPFGLNVGGYYDRHPIGRRLAGKERIESDTLLLSPAEASQRVARWTHGAHLVGVNPAFDAETLNALLRANGVLPAWNYHLIDVTAMALGYLHREARSIIENTTDNDEWQAAVDLQRLVIPPYKSDELGKALGVTPLPPERRHTALGDAEWALAMYDAMTGTASR